MNKIINFVRQNFEELFLSVLIVPVLLMMLTAVGITMFGFAYSLISLM